MPAELPWRSREELIAALTELRNEADAQIVALQLRADPDDVEGRHRLLVYRYILHGNAKRVAEWANAHGWKHPSPKGGRKYAGDDVLRMAFEEPQVLPPVLREFAVRAFGVTVSNRLYPRG